MEDSTEKPSGAIPETRSGGESDREGVAMDNPPPVLPRPTQRKLAVQWDTTRDELKLTDEQVSSYDRERQRLTAVTGIGSARAQSTAHALGLYSSTRAAEQRFRAFDAEYWPLWCSSSMQYGWYQSWLASLTRSIVGELASIWMGRSGATDRWFEHTCRPELERALSKLEKKRIAQARSVEVQSTGTRTLPYPQQGSVLGFQGFQPNDVMRAQDQTYSRYRRGEETREPVSLGGAVKVEIPTPRPHTRMQPPGASLEQMAGAESTGTTPGFMRGRMEQLYQEFEQYAKDSKEELGIQVLIDGDQCNWYFTSADKPGGKPVNSDSVRVFQILAEQAALAAGLTTEGLGLEGWEPWLIDLVKNDPNFKRIAWSPGSLQTEGLTEKDLIEYAEWLYPEAARVPSVDLAGYVQLLRADDSPKIPRVGESITRYTSTAEWRYLPRVFKASAIRCMELSSLAPHVEDTLPLRKWVRDQELFESLQRWENDGGAIRVPTPPSREGDNEVYISDRWCCTGGPDAQWDRIGLRETFLSLSSDFLGSRDLVLDFLLNATDPNMRYFKRPFLELKDKLADLRNKARREGDQAIELHCAKLEERCDELLKRGGASVRAILRGDHTGHDETSCARITAETRSKAYEWLKMCTAERSATVGPAAVTAGSPPHAPGSSEKKDKPYRFRRKDDKLENIRELVRRARAERASHQQICERLGNHPRPPHAAWRDLPWPQAYLKHPRSVAKWISSCCK